MSARRIVVGVDGSPSSIHALRWAVANRRDDDAIEAVLSWEYPPLAMLPAPLGMVVPPKESMQDSAEEAMAKSVAEAGVGQEIAVEETVRYGSAADTLLAAGNDGDMIIVGTRGSSISKVFLGSVSRRVLHRAEVPVVVVPLDAPLGHADRVLVGIDGSDHSVAALRWARTLQTERIDVMHTWQMASSYPPYMVPTPVADIEAIAAAVTDNVIREALDGDTDDRLYPVVIGGDARTLLIDSGLDPSLIVVGARGYTGLTGMLIGSVADHVASHADVAVAVVPAPADDGDD